MLFNEKKGSNRILYNPGLNNPPILLLRHFLILHKYHRVHHLNLFLQHGPFTIIRAIWLIWIFTSYLTYWCLLQIVYHVRLHLIVGCMMGCLILWKWLLLWDLLHDSGLLGLHWAYCCFCYFALAVVCLQLWLWL